MDNPRIALITDFGNQDIYVGVMKGVMARIAPQVQVIDLTHLIPPGNIAIGAFQLWRAYSFFPEGTIFICVVDPGVGSERRPIAIRFPGLSCVGPDNGLFTYLIANLGPGVAVEIQNPAYILSPTSATFHGRDLFAPAAAHIANDVPVEALGPCIKDLTRIPLPQLELIQGPRIQGEILFADRFGNLITSIGIVRVERDDLVLEPWLPHCPPARLPLPGLRVRLPNGALLSLSNYYADVPPGELLAYIGSSGMIEIAINQGSAAQTLPLTPGQQVLLSYEG